MTWWEWALAAAILLGLVVFVPLRFRWERRQIEAFDATDLEHFKVVTDDWRCERIKKRAHRLGWDPFQENYENPRESMLVLKRSGDSSAPLPVLLRRLHNAGLLPRLPQRGILDLEEAKG